MWSSTWKFHLNVLDGSLLIPDLRRCYCHSTISSSAPENVYSCVLKVNRRSSLTKAPTWYWWFHLESPAHLRMFGDSWDSMSLCVYLGGIRRVGNRIKSRCIMKRKKFKLQNSTFAKALSKPWKDPSNLFTWNSHVLVNLHDVKEFNHNWLNDHLFLLWLLVRVSSSVGSLGFVGGWKKYFGVGQSIMEIW